MTRSPKTAHNAGTTFERIIANHLRKQLNNPTIARKITSHHADSADIINVYHHTGTPIAIECKNQNTPQYGTWFKQATNAAHNMNTNLKIIVAKTPGISNPNLQHVIMDTETFTLFTNIPEPEITNLKDSITLKTKFVNPKKQFTTQPDKYIIWPYIKGKNWISMTLEKFIKIISKKNI